MLTCMPLHLYAECALQTAFRRALLYRTATLIQPKGLNASCKNTGQEEEVKMSAETRE